MRPPSAIESVLQPPRSTSGRSVLRRVRSSLLLQLALVGAGAVLLGVLTLELSGSEPGVLEPFVNAPSGWALLCALLVRLAAPAATWRGALLGVVGLVGLDLGWYVVGGGGGSVYASFWYAVAVLAGPPVGIAAGWLGRPGARRAIGAGLLAGICFGDAVAGTTLLSAMGPEGAAVITVIGGLLMVRGLLQRGGIGVRLLVVPVAGATAVAYITAWFALTLVL